MDVVLAEFWRVGDLERCRCASGLWLLAPDLRGCEYVLKGRDDDVSGYCLLISEVSFFKDGRICTWIREAFSFELRVKTCSRSMRNYDIWAS